jgi:hypothetical protein
MDPQELKRLQISAYTPQQTYDLIRHTDTVGNNYIESANKLVAEANETERHLSGQLVLLNTVLLTASLVALGNEKLFDHLSATPKVLMFSILLLQVFSIISGIASYREIERFYITCAQNKMKSNTIARNLNGFNTIEEMESKLAESDKEAPGGSSQKWLKRQINSLIAGLSLLLFLVLLMIF